MYGSKLAYEFVNKNVIVVTENGQLKCFANWIINDLWTIGHFQKYHVCLPKFCTTIAFIFTWDHSMSQEKTETMFMQNFGGTNKDWKWPRLYTQYHTVLRDDLSVKTSAVYIFPMASNWHFTSRSFFIVWLIFKWQLPPWFDMQICQKLL